MNKRTGLSVVLAISLLLALFGCNQSSTPPEIPDDEILLRIQLDLKEDIGLLVVDYDAEGFSGSGGTSNADKSLLKRDELIDYTLDSEHYGELSHLEDLSLQFTIITAYCDPNYDNIYPLEYTKPLEALELDVDFGSTYHITITGDRTNGYTAVLDE